MTSSQLEREIEMEADRLEDTMSGLHFSRPELVLFAEKTYEANVLKKEKGAVFLAHHYQRPEIKFGIADFVGDSLELSTEAAKLGSRLIIFCGVHFMAETAKILNPCSKIVIPDEGAGCSLVSGFSWKGNDYEGLSAQDCIDLKSKFPGFPLVSYINSTAEVKAESETCVTSSNSRQVIEKLGNRIIYVPDINMAKNIGIESGRNLVIAQPDGLYKIIELSKTKAGHSSSSEVVGYQDALDYARSNRVLVGKNGKCEVHEKFSKYQIEGIRRENPGIEVISHLECGADVAESSNYVGSTSGMIRHLKGSKAKKVFMMTECSMGSTLRNEFPDKEFYTPCVICPHMGKISLENALDALRNERPEITLSPEIISRARKALDRMYELTKS